MSNITVILAASRQDGIDAARARGLEPGSVVIAHDEQSSQRARGLPDPHVIVLPFFWNNPDAETIAGHVALTQTDAAKRRAIFENRVG
jgi:hypothetical protein